MIRRSNFLSRVTIAGTAALGLLLGHYLDYLVAIPDHAHRDAVLTSTGHGYIRTALVFALAAAVVSAVAAFALGIRKVRGGEPSGLTFGSTSRRLSSVQIGSFVALEVLERLLSGGSFRELAVFLLIGVVAQVFVAMVGAVILVLLTHVGEVVARIMARRFASQSATENFCTDQHPGKHLTGRCRPIRGPPSSLVILKST